jgi:adenosylmethionine-8-amino-7-oxononanoate aminotransferase
MFKPLLFEATFVDSPCGTGGGTGVPPVGSSVGSARTQSEETHGRDAHATVLAQIDRELSQHPNDYAAVIIEPLIQAAAGMLTHPPGFLRDLRELTRRRGVLLIADEVATGFCRTGKMFACEHEGVSPDLLCLGKGLSGGYLPVAATLASQEIFDSFCGSAQSSPFDGELTAEPPSGQPEDQSGYGGRTFFHGHTFTGNALGCAAAVASIDLIKSSRLLESLPAKIALIRDTLAPLANHPHVADIRQCGMMAGIELVRHRPKSVGRALPDIPVPYDPSLRASVGRALPDIPVPYDPWLRMGAKVCQEAMKRGVIIRPLGDVVVLMPAPAMDMATLKTLLDATKAAISAVLGPP